MAGDVERIKERIAIAELVGSYVKLERAGQNMKARCPFHTEKTPSFFVSPSRNSYYCFGCGAKGDIFSFVEAFESTDFLGALRILADRAGVALEGRNPGAEREAERLRDAHESAAAFYESALQTHIEAREIIHYLTGRGLHKETLVAWRIGYAPNSWRSLSDHLRKEGFKDDEIEKAGLGKRRDADCQRVAESRLYDRFRGRIMFPLFDSAGRIIAFSGRVTTTGTSEAKYINSPESPLYRKSQYLYGLHAAKLKIRGHGSAIVVEGQMDLIMCHQAGFDNAVALSGTALTKEHLERLKRFTDRVIIALDSDKAGQSAGRRTAAFVLEEGLEARIAELPPNEDPADVLRRDPSVFAAAVQSSLHLVTFVENMVFRQQSDPLIRVRQIRSMILPLIARIESKMEQGQFVSGLAARAGLAESTVWDDLSHVYVSAEPHPTSAKTEPLQEKDRDKGSIVERHLLGFLNSEMLIASAGTTREVLQTRMSECIGLEAVQSLVERHTAHVEAAVFEAEQYYVHSKRITDDLDDLLGRLVDEHLRQELLTLIGEISAAERRDASTDMEGLLERYRRIAERLSDRSKLLNSSRPNAHHD